MFKSTPFSLLLLNIKTKIMIIAVSGYSGSGKDTIGTIIQYLFCQEVNDTSIEEACAKYQEHEWWLEERSGWEIRKFAGKLKDIAGHLINVDVKKFEDQEFKKTNLGPDWNIDGKPMSVRDLLQKLGTDAMRNGLHPVSYTHLTLPTKRIV